MRIETISQIKKMDYLNKNFPSTEIIDVTHGSENSAVVYAKLNEIKNLPSSAYPVGSFQKDGHVVGVFADGIQHTMTIGTTGVGKTTGELINDVIMMSRKNGAPSMIINDTGGGEIAKAVIPELRKTNKYKWHTINLSEPDRSDRYNVLENVKNVILNIRNQGIPLHKCSQLESYVENIINTLQPIDSKVDPIWDIGANDFMKGVLWDMIEDLYDCNIPKESFNVYNMLCRYAWIRNESQSGYGKRLEEIPHFKEKPQGAMSVKKLQAVCNNNERTSGSYLGVVENHNATICKYSMFMTTSDCTISVANFVESPTVIFINTGSSPVGDAVVSFFIKDVYSYLEEKRKRQVWINEKGREIHAYVDEFANSRIADGKTFVQILAEARKYGLFFHIYLQSDSQLISKYDEKIAKTIKENCTLIFMGSEDYATIRNFSDTIGKKTVEDYTSLQQSGTTRFITVDALPPEKLRMMPMYHSYVVHKGSPVLFTRYEPYYKCKEIEVETDYDAVYPFNDFDYTQTFFDIANIGGEKHFSSYKEAFLNELDEDLCLDDEQEDENGEIITMKFKAKDAQPASPVMRDFNLSELSDLYLNDGQCFGEEIEISKIAKLNLLPLDILKRFEQFSVTSVKVDKLEQIINAEIERLGDFAKFEIIEAFLASNSFNSVDKCIKAYQKARAKLHSIVSLSVEVGLVFTKTEEWLAELTNEDVKEIKRIINSADD